MSHKQTLKTCDPQKGFSFGLQPALAWTAILGLVIITVIGALFTGRIIRIAFPISCFLVGLLLYCRYPVLYIGFSWWVWFLTPFVARVVDWRSGWDPQRLMLVSPFLVVLITAATFFRYFPRSYRQGGLPFILAFFSLVYSFLVGLINGSPIPTTRALLDWISPIFFGFYLFINWRDYPNYRQNITRTFTWCVLVTGIYGVVQYLVAPAWDCFWIHETKLVTNGLPQPLGIRVFSTMHSPLPFSNVMLAGLLLLFNSQGVLRIPASVAGYLAFLLSLVRSAWGGWIVGMVTLLTSLKPRLQMRLIITLVVMALCVLPLATVEPFSEIIGDRVASITDIKRDTSYYDRTLNYEKNLNLALSAGLGNGMGNIFSVGDNGAIGYVVLDSGILESLFTLGWFGAIPYFSGVVLLIFSLFQGIEARFDPFLGAARAIGLGIFAQIWFGSSMISLSGMVMWSFFGIAMAGRKYYQYQRVVTLQKIQQN